MVKRLTKYIGTILLNILPMRAFHNVNRRILIFMGYKIGEGVVFYSSSKILGLVNVEIGDNTFFGHNSLIMGGDSKVIIGKNCDISSAVSLITGTHDIGSTYRRAGTGISKNIEIGDGTWVGYGVTILGGVTIGSGCIIAAGSVVNKSMPPNVIIAGVPARIIKNLE